jgi:hypothetical protein
MSTIPKKLKKLYGRKKTCIRDIIALTRMGFKQYGYLKNCYSAFVRLTVKDNKLQTFSNAHVAENHCCVLCFRFSCSDTLNFNHFKHC